MKIDTSHSHVLAPLDIEVSFPELAQKITPSRPNPEMLKTAKKVFNRVQQTWQPAAVYRWLGFQPPVAGTTGQLIQNGGSPLEIDFGYSMKFLKPARIALAAVCTAGQALEHASRRASGKGDLLEAYFLDLIGLIVLEKAGTVIKEIAIAKAVAAGWGVSPFLSPGSVHGWELEEQAKLCSLLPLEKIDVAIREDAVLSPFKSLSCLIGLGPGYDSVTVGTTCRVCSKRDDCRMKEEGIFKMRRHLRSATQAGQVGGT